MTITISWKKIYQTLSGVTKQVTPELVQNVLTKTRNDFLTIFLKYRPYTKSSHEKWASKVEVSDYMKDFVHELGLFLNLETPTTYIVTCNYLMFDYYGQVNEFWQVTTLGNCVQLKEQIWMYYTTERMFALKCWRYILENYNNEKSFSSQFKKFLDEIEIPKLYENLAKQFEVLLDELTSIDPNEASPNLERRLTRNVREQIEILSILTLLVQISPVPTNQAAKFFEIFVSSNFGVIPPTFMLRQNITERDLQELAAVEMGCYLIVLSSFLERGSFLNNEEGAHLNKTFLNLQTNQENCLVMILWAVVRFKFVLEETTISSDLFAKKPFVYLQKVLACDVFENTLIGEFVFERTYNLLDEVCLLYDKEKEFFLTEGVVPSFELLMKLPKLAERSVLNRGGVDRILTISIETFPYMFYPFCSIMRTMLKSYPEREKLAYLVTHMTDYLSGQKWTKSTNISTLVGEFVPFPNSGLFFLPQGRKISAYRLADIKLTKIHSPYNFFIYMEEVINQLVTTVRDKERIDHELIKRIAIAYDIALNIVKFCKGLNLEQMGVLRFLGYLPRLLKLVNGNYKSLHLVKVYLNALYDLTLYAPSMIPLLYSDCVQYDFFPRIKCHINTNKTEKMLFVPELFEDTLIPRTIQDEELTDDHSFALVFLKLTHNLMLHNTNDKITLQSVTYMLNFMFMQHLRWRYTDENQRHQITYTCLHLLHEILQKGDDKKQGENFVKLYNLVLEAVYFNDSIISTIFSFLIKDRHFIQFTMEREINWEEGSSLIKLQSLRMELAIIVVVITLKPKFGSQLIYHKLVSLVKPVASYFTNPYNDKIINLSCKYVEKVAEDTNVALLALLELDHYQIQALFLERLRDPLISDDIKESILSLINTCIRKQPGMTAAFFNLKCYLLAGCLGDEAKGDSVCDFIVDYLLNMKKSVEYLKDPLQLAILRILHSVWINHRDSLMEDISTIPHFWPGMFEVFLHNFDLNPEVYVSILEIAIIEITVNPELNDSMKTTVYQFFKNKKNIDRWHSYLHQQTKNPTKDSVKILYSYADFLRMVKSAALDNAEQDIKTGILIACIDGILKVSGNNQHNGQMVLGWCKAYVGLSPPWQFEKSLQRYAFDQLIAIIRSASAYYDFIHPASKEGILSVIYAIFINIQDLLDEVPSLLHQVICPITKLINAEYRYIESESWRKVLKSPRELHQHMKPWQVCTFLMGQVVQTIEKSEVSDWPRFEKIPQRIIKATSLFVKYKETLKYAEYGLDFLLYYADSKYSNELIDMELPSLSYRLPHTDLCINTKAVGMGMPTHLKTMWLVYTLVLRLYKILMYKFGARVIQQLTFLLKDHDLAFYEMISLPQTTVDITALNLTAEALKLVYLHLKYLPLWDPFSPPMRPVYARICSAVCTAVNASALSFVGYKKINFYTVTEENNLIVVRGALTDLLVPCLTKILDVIYWGCAVLKSTKPEIAFEPNQYLVKGLSIWVQPDFGVPRFVLPVSNELTYGSLLYLADHISKILGQKAATKSSDSKEVNEGFEEEMLKQSFESYKNLIAFMIFMEKTDDMSTEKLSSILHYDKSELTATGPLTKLNTFILRRTFESLLFFLGMEIAALQEVGEEYSTGQFKRELTTEMQFFFEFVKKKGNEDWFTAEPEDDTTEAPPANGSRLLTKAPPGKSHQRVKSHFLTDMCSFFSSVCDLGN